VHTAANLAQFREAALQDRERSLSDVRRQMAECEGVIEALKAEIRSLHEAAARKEEETEDERRAQLQMLKEKAEDHVRAMQLQAGEAQKDRDSLERRHKAELARVRAELEEQMRQLAESSQVSQDRQRELLRRA
jgi:hypothetical protein